MVQYITFLFYWGWAVFMVDGSWEATVQGFAMIHSTRSGSGAGSTNGGAVSIVWICSAPCAWRCGCWSGSWRHSGCSSASCAWRCRCWRRACRSPYRRLSAWREEILRVRRVVLLVGEWADLVEGEVSRFRISFDIIIFLHLF
jgi:hypothetical protein